MGKLDGQVAIVTGASRGLGRAVAIGLAAEGAAVAITARTAEQLEAVAAEIRGRGGKVLPIAADITRYEDVERIVAGTLDAFGRIDILVNNAGTGIFAPVVEASLDDWNLMLDVNFKGTAYCSKAVLPQMLAQRSGHIINVASVAGIHGIPTQSVYCASKFAVVGFAQALAQEVVGRGVRVATLCPGGINTPFWDGTPYPAGSEAREQIMSPEGVADLVLAVATQPKNVLLRQAVFFPLNEWH